MRHIAIPDSHDIFVLGDRPADDEYEPLPYGLTLDDAVIVRAYEVERGDLVVAEFRDPVKGKRLACHIPGPFRAEPHTFANCPCDGCVECDDVDAWTLADHSRLADVAIRFYCLAPAQDVLGGREPCVMVYRNAPIAVIREDAVERAKAAAPELEPLVGQLATEFRATDGGELETLAYLLRSAVMGGALPDDSHRRAEQMLARIEAVSA
ncbi:hypothetical protein QR97_01780 [Streptomyces sp. PBH53]|uniref:hypothetical protein n=1 Tax=Streptomyces sp. PBH53 TaxID=1577075 RepID=UPI0006551016|nr:hypothetical protein [Streptomyces sp. PBH53]AKN68702.1 hypothetical protein QR97_01780 [Streptomyces sp. PBH53]